MHLGAMAALDDSPRPGRAPQIADAAKAWLVSLPCQKAKDPGYPHGLWTTRLLARHIRTDGVAAGHPCLRSIVQGTVCKIHARSEVKPHKVRYYLARRDGPFETKMADVLCVYHEVTVLPRVTVLPAHRGAETNVAIISYDEKPGIQAIDTTAPDLPPQPFHALGSGRRGAQRHSPLICIIGQEDASPFGACVAHPASRNRAALVKASCLSIGVLPITVRRPRPHQGWRAAAAWLPARG